MRLGFFHNIIRNYKLRHIKLGKVRYKGGAFEEWDGYADFRIKGMSWDLHWQTDIYLAAIIRDYLRDFNERTPAIGNCVLLDNPEGIPYEDFLFNRYEGDIDFGARWHELVAKVADEFDELLRIMRANDVTKEQIDNMAKKAFADLAYIFADLEY